MVFFHIFQECRSGYGGMKWMDRIKTKDVDEN